MVNNYILAPKYYLLDTHMLDIASLLFFLSPLCFWTLMFMYCVTVLQLDDLKIYDDIRKQHPIEYLLNKTPSPFTTKSELFNHLAFLSHFPQFQPITVDNL